MPDVVRKVLIEVETRQKKSRLDAPDVGSAERAFKAESEAAEKATKSHERHAEVVRQSRVSMVNDFREAGEGALRMARGLTLLSASGSDDLKKLVQHVAIAQGAFDVFAGSAKVLRHLTSALGPLGTAVGAVGVAAAGAAAGWKLYASGVADARQTTEQAKDITDRYAESLAHLRSAHQASLTGQASRRALEGDIAEFGGRAGLRTHDENLRTAFERDQQPGFTHLEEIIRSRRTHLLDPRQLEQAQYTEGRQLQILEERLGVNKKIRDLEQEELRDKFSATLIGGAFGAALSPGAAGAIGASTGASIAGEQRSFLEQHRQFMQDLLNAMLEQRKILNAVSEHVHSQPR